MRALFSTFSIIAVLYAASVCAQTPAIPKSCLSEQDVQKMIEQIAAGKDAAPNEVFREALLKLNEVNQKSNQKAIEKSLDKKTISTVPESRESKEVTLCGLLKQHGFATVSRAGKDGALANLTLLKNVGSVPLHLDLVPVIGAALKKNELEKNEAYATFVDRLRLRGGLKQFYGTQAVNAEGFIMIEPIADEANVDARRKLFGLMPLGAYIKGLEQSYRRPVIKSPVVQGDVESIRRDDSAEKASISQVLKQEGDLEDEAIKVETKLVSLNVTIQGTDSKNSATAFEQKDFQLWENGKQEQITFFSKTDVPFDLVLVIDLSGSTATKIDLIRKTTARFVNAARPVDRLAIVTFADDIDVVSPLTEDRAALLEQAKKIKGSGFSRVWDGLQYTLKNVLGPKTLDRRSAVVFMTDGVDSSLTSFSNYGSETSFSELLETVRKSDAVVIPIYLDTEGSDNSPPRTYENARATLRKLADESGGLYYKAKKIEDLNGVYEKVLNDLGKVYSVGYEPSDEKRDGRWRTVKITIPTQPNLVVHTKPGYYAY